jgi:hypothetical protein
MLRGMRALGALALSLGAAAALCRAIIACESFDAAAPPAPSADGGALDAEVADAGSSGCSRLSPQPKHCWDFDRGDLREGWSGQEINLEAGAFELDDAVAVSSPFSARVLVKPSPPACSYLKVSRSVAAAVDRALLAFHVRLGSADGTNASGAAAALLDLKSGPQQVALYVVVGRNESQIMEQVGGVSISHSFELLPIGQWRHLELAFRAPSSVALRVGGKSAVTFELSVAFASTITSLEASVGAHCLAAGSTEPTEIRFDDVVLDYQ